MKKKTFEKLFPTVPEMSKLYTGQSFAEYVAANPDAFRVPPHLEGYLTTPPAPNFSGDNRPAIREHIPSMWLRAVLAGNKPYVMMINEPIIMEVTKEKYPPFRATRQALVIRGYRVFYVENDHKPKLMAIWSPLADSFLICGDMPWSRGRYEFPVPPELRIHFNPTPTILHRMRPDERTYMTGTALTNEESLRFEYARIVRRAMLNRATPWGNEDAVQAVALDDGDPQGFAAQAYTRATDGVAPDPVRSCMRLLRSLGANTMGAVTELYHRHGAPEGTHLSRALQLIDNYTTN